MRTYLIFCVIALPTSIYGRNTVQLQPAKGLDLVPVPQPIPNDETDTSDNGPAAGDDDRRERGLGRGDHGRGVGDRHRPPFGRIDQCSEKSYTECVNSAVPSCQLSPGLECTSSICVTTTGCVSRDVVVDPPGLPRDALCAGRCGEGISCDIETNCDSSGFCEYRPICLEGNNSQDQQNEKTQETNGTEDMTHR